MSDRPLFQQLADLLRDRIDSGALQPGDSLPTQAQLVAEHSVSTSVVREAIDVLRGEGRVESFRGKGVLVRTPPVRRMLSSGRYARQLARSAADATGTPGESSRPAEDDGGGEDEPGGLPSAFGNDQGVGLADTSVDCQFGKVPAPATVADLFGIAAGAPVFRRHMVWRAMGIAKRITVGWFPLDLVAGTPMTDPKRQPWPGGVIAELVALGLKFASMDEDVTGRMPTPDEAFLLRVPGGTPLFIVDRVGRARLPNDDPALPPRVVEVAELILPCDRWGLHNRLEF